MNRGLPQWGIKPTPGSYAADLGNAIDRARHKAVDTSQRQVVKVCRCDHRSRTHFVILPATGVEVPC
jgi:hypothetical protein